jgi:hypothetical protein
MPEGCEQGWEVRFPASELLDTLQLSILKDWMISFRDCKCAQRSSSSQRDDSRCHHLLVLDCLREGSGCVKISRGRSSALRCKFIRFQYLEFIPSLLQCSYDCLPGEIVHMPLASATVTSCYREDSVCVPSFPLFLTADVCKEENIVFFLRMLSSNLCLYGGIDSKHMSDFEVSVS